MYNTIKQNYRSSNINDGWKYRFYGTTILGINDTTNQMKTITFNTMKEMKREFNRLTGRKKGRPAERKRTLTTKRTIV